MQNFYTLPENFSDKAVSLVGDEYFHATRSCRVKIGEMIGVTDGLGRRVHARIKSIDKKSLTAVIERDVSGTGEPPVEITLAISVLKPARFEIAVEKCTELGVRNFIPVISDKCKPNIAKQLKIDRLERIALEASKQSGRSWVPDISSPMNLADTLKQTEAPVLVAVQNADKNLLETLSLFKNTGKVMILIGPEGDFSFDEYALMSDSGAFMFSMGKLTFRSETAGITAVALLVNMAV